MKTLITLFVLAFVAEGFCVSEELRANGTQVKASCIEKEAVTEEEVAQIKSGDFSNPNRNIRCFVSCFLEGVNFVDSEGNLIPDHVVEKLSGDGDREQIQAAVDACKDISADDKCEKAFMLHQCFHEQRANKQI